MIDLTELDAKVREARADAIAEYHEGMTTEREVDELIAAVRRHERARCRQAVEGEDTEYLDTDWARGVSAAITDALAAIDALEG